MHEITFIEADPISNFKLEYLTHGQQPLTSYKSLIISEIWNMETIEN